MYSVVPKMKLLHKIVIPKISSEWKKVADFLEIEFSIIDIIQENFNGEPSSCCEEILREWLRSDHGVQPKTWSTLITSIKEIKHLAAASEEIKKELTSKSPLITLSTLVLPVHRNYSFTYVMPYTIYKWVIYIKSAHFWTFLLAKLHTLG